MGFHEMPFTLLTLLVVLLAAADAVAASDLAKPDCQSNCGNLTIPFPFGTKKGCYLEDKTNSFYVTCINDSQLYLGESENNFLVANISVDGEVKVFSIIAHACFKESGELRDAKPKISLGHPKFTISYTRNKFTVVGCNTFAIIEGDTLGLEYFMGCKPTCKKTDDAINGSCSGTACCQFPFPEGQREFKATISNSLKGNYVFPCSYAFLVEENAYNFSSLDLKDLQGRERFPVVLDWFVGNETCEQAEKNQSSFACTALNSDCIPSSNGPGYRCNCSSGYEGNPYLVDGCKDIDECKRPKSCLSTATCVNVPGNFTCSCPEGYEGDGILSCTEKSQKSANLGIPLGISMSFLGLMVASSLVYCLLAKRKLMKQREKFFKQNGGFMLTEQLSKHEKSIETAKIFKAEDLKKATNNYDKSRIIGQGGYGTVFKGVLSPNGKEVAIKKSKICDCWDTFFERLHYST